MLNESVRLAQSAIVLVVFFLFLFGAFYVYRTLRTPLPPEIIPGVPNVAKPQDPIIDFQPDDIVFADTTFELERVRVEDAKDIPITITVQDTLSDYTARLYVEVKPAGWFPEITGRDRVHVRSVGSGRGITVTRQPVPLINLEIVPMLGVTFNPFADSTGSRFSGIAGASLLRFGPVHAGPVVTYPSLAYGGAAWIEVREKLYIGSGGLSNGSAFVSLAYGF